QYRVSLNIPRVTLYAVGNSNQSRLYTDAIPNDRYTEDLVAPGQIVFTTTSKGYIIVINGQPAWVYDRTTSKIFCINAPT
ncbi:MAG: hypothetical protein GY725_01560, partial [bacterium]|nr:hypothetical protein [bacterium]